MSWRAREERRMFLRRSLWVLPVAGMVAALLVARGARWVDDRTHWVLMGFGSDGAKALLSTISAAHLTFVVFAFSILLLAVQLASSQLSPRIIARVFENRFVKVVLGAFVFTFTYSVSALSRAEERVPELTVLLSILFSLMSIVLFIYMMQSIGRGFRPITILTKVADDTRAVIESFYPHPFVPGAGERPAF